MTNPNPNPNDQPDAEESDLIIFPQLFDSEPKTRLLGLYGEVNEESCKQLLVFIICEIQER